MIRAMRHFSIVFLIACGGASPKPSTTGGPPSAAQGPSCGQVADHMMAMITADAKDAPQDAVDQLRIKLIEACEDTQWSLAARRCVMDAKVGTETRACEPMFTEAQRAAWGPPSAPPAPPSAPPAPPPPAMAPPAPPAAEPAAVAPAESAPAQKAGPAKSKAKSPRKPAPNHKGSGIDSDPCDGGE